MKKLMLLASVVMFSVATIGSISSSGDLKVNEAFAAGTCCDGQGGTCYPNGCQSADCAVDNAWWRSDGKRCNAPYDKVEEPVQVDGVVAVNQ